MKKTQTLSSAQRTIGKKIPGGRISVTEPLFPGHPRLYSAIKADGTVVAHAEALADLIRQVRKAA